MTEVDSEYLFTLVQARPVLWHKFLNVHISSQLVVCNSKIECFGAEDPSVLHETIEFLKSMI